MNNYDQIANLIKQDLNIQTINTLTDVSVNTIELIAANVELEGKMQALGSERYLARQESLKGQGKAFETDATMSKVKQMLRPFANEIAVFRDNYKSRKPHIAVEVFKRHDEHQLALMTMRACIAAETTGKNELASLCTRLCGSIESDLEVQQAYRVGYKLISMMCAQSDACFEIKKIYSDKKTIHVIEATDHFYEWEEEQEAELAEMATILRPMVVPPRPWTSLNRGGYYDHDMQQRFIRNAPKVTEKTHGVAAIPLVYKSVNQIQATPFTVNNFVLDAANELVFDDELFFDKWYMEIPERPHNERTRDLRATIEECNAILGITPENREEKGKGFGQWVKDMLFLITEGHERYQCKKTLEDARFKMVQYINWRKELTSVKSKNRVVKVALEVANDYSDFSSIWFPANLDWRMRVYPMCSGLTTQGVCLQKALIKFAKGKPIGTKEALYWLMVHVANCHGQDKSSWQDRLKWTVMNSDLIKRVADDPCDTVDEWKGTDSPWLFIAACEQMAKYYKDGLAAVVDIPIPMDGTCNGAQHYAAMTRDRQGAYGVNVAPNGTQGLQERLNELRKTNPTVSHLEAPSLLTKATNFIMTKVIGETK